MKKLSLIFYIILYGLVGSYDFYLGIVNFNQERYGLGLFCVILGLVMALFTVSNYNSLVLKYKLEKLHKFLKEKIRVLEEMEKTMNKENVEKTQSVDKRS